MKRFAFKRGLAVILAVAMVMTGMNLTGFGEVETQAAVNVSNPRWSKDDDGNDVVTWDLVEFGSYPQSDTTGTTKEPIQWRVLWVDGNDAFLLADKILDCQPYDDETDTNETSYDDETDTNETWSSCTLRTWLNETFYNTAFSSAEKGAINTTNVVNDDYPYYGTEGDDNTTDNVFLLSIDEVVNTDYGFENTNSSFESETREAQVTPYANAQGVFWSTSEDDYHNGRWFLRSPNSVSAAYVATSGYLYGSGPFFPDNDGVRPALHVNISSSSLSYAGTVTSAGTNSGGGSSSGGESGGESGTGGGTSGGTASTMVECTPLTIGEDASGETTDENLTRFFPGDWSLSPAEFPIKCSKETNPDGSYTLKLSIGIGREDLFDSKTSWSKYQKIITELSDKTHRLMDAYEVKNVSNLKTKGFKLLPKMSCVGYAEIKCDKNGNIIEKPDIKLSTNFDWNAISADWIMWTSAGPIYLNLKWGIAAKLKANPDFDMSKMQVYLKEGSIALESNVTIEGGYGISKVATIGAYGKMDFTVEIFPHIKKKFTSNAKLVASAGAHLYIAFFIDKEWVLVEQEYPFWDTTDTSGGGFRSAATKGILLKSAPNYTVESDTAYIDTDFTKYESAWNGSDSAAKAASKSSTKAAAKSISNDDKATVIKNGLLTTSLPVVKQVGDKKVMIFQDYDSSRGKMDAVVLKYSVFDNGQWSDPIAIDDDGTGDFYADAQVIDDKLYVAWQDSKAAYNGDENDMDAALTAIGEGSEICFAEFDTSNDTFTNVTAVTDNDVADSMPKISDNNGAPMLTYVRNSAGDLTQESGTTKIYMRTWNTGSSSFDDETSLCTVASVDDYAVSDGEVYYVAKREDGDSVIYDSDGDEVYEPDEGDETVGITALHASESGIEFCANGELIAISGSTETSLLPEGASVGQNGTWCTNGTKSAYVWSDYDKDSDTGSIMAVVNTDSGYSEPVTLFEKKGVIIRSISALLGDNGNWYFLTNAEDTSESETVCALMSVSVSEKEELGIDYAALNEFDVDDDGNTGIDYAVTNTSDKPVNSIVIKVTDENGNLIAQKTVNATLQPGESVYDTAYLDLSDIDDAQNVKVYVYASGQTDVSDNYIETEAGLTDVAVSGTITESDSSAQVTVNLQNLSEVAATADLSLTLDNKKLASKNEISVSAGGSNTASFTIAKSDITYNENNAAYIKIETTADGGDYDESNNTDYVILYKEDDSQGSGSDTSAGQPGSGSGTSTAQTAGSGFVPAISGIIQQDVLTGASTAPGKATIKASKAKVKYGSKTTIKLTSNSGTKLTIKAANKLAKAAVKSKSVKLKSGKKGKLIFMKNAKKGTYKFKVTSAAGGGFLKTAKTITIKVK